MTRRAGACLALLALCALLSGCAARRVEWRFAVETARAARDEAYARDGTLLASVDYELPRLALAGENAAPGAAPPEELAAVRDTFNAEMERFFEGLPTLRELRVAAADDRELLRRVGADSFSGYESRLAVAETWRTERLVSVCVRGAERTGGVHTIPYAAAWSFDLRDGRFLMWSDLTDRPDALRRALANEILAQIGTPAEAYYPDYADDVRALEGACVWFGGDGVRVAFSAYQLSSDERTFTVPYARVAECWNAYGRELLEKPADS